MHAGTIRSWCAGCDREGIRVIGLHEVSVGLTVIRIQIPHMCCEDLDRTLLAGLEVDVGRDDPVSGTSRNYRGVGASVCASEVVPCANDFDRLAEENRNTAVARGRGTSEGIGIRVRTWVKSAPF